MPGGGGGGGGGLTTIPICPCPWFMLLFASMCDALNLPDAVRLLAQWHLHGSLTY